MALVFLALVAMLTACGSGSASPKATVSPTENAASAETLPSRMVLQLIALLDGEQVRLAYNTCQSCAGSPYAYFEYEDGLLTCQNCGNQFGLDSVGAVVGGCNPLPVGEASVENDSVVIPASELKANAPAFTNWRKFS